MEVHLRWAVAAPTLEWVEGRTSRPLEPLGAK